MRQKGTFRSITLNALVFSPFLLLFLYLMNVINYITSFLPLPSFEMYHAFTFCIDLNPFNLFGDQNTLFMAVINMSDTILPLHDCF